MKKRIFALILCASLMTGEMTFWQAPVVKAETVSDNESKDGKVAVKKAATQNPTSPAGVIYANSRDDFRDESIYFVMTTRFYDGDSENNVQCWDGTQYDDPDDPEWRGDFKGLAEKLDYIKALGFTAIWITPVVENCSGYDYHGYHALNFSKVDPRYESSDFTYQDFINAAHAKGLKVIQDVVFNHTGNFGETNLFPMIEKQGDLSSSDCMKTLPNSGLPTDYNQLLPARQYNARIEKMKSETGDPEHIYHHEKSLGWEEYSCQTAQIAGDCVDLNTENPKVYKYLQDAYNSYIDMGVDAFRVDTAKHISRLTFNNALIQPFYDEAEKNGNDSFYMFGEVCTRDRDVWNKGVPPLSAPFYTWKESKDYAWSDTDRTVNEQSTLDNFNDNKDIEAQPTSDNAFLNGNDYHTPDYSKNSKFGVIDFPMHWNFENAGSAYGIALSGDKWYNDATWNVTYVDSHDYAPDQAPSDQRFAGSQDTWAENLSLMFTFRGIPCIYYGSEVEFQKGKMIDVGPNDALSNTGRAYFGDNIEGEVTTTDFGEYFGATGTMKKSLNYPLSKHIQRLNRIRQAVPALRKGQYSTSNIDGNMAFKRRYTDDKTDSFALVTISNSATFNNIPNGTYVDCITGDTKNVTNGSLTAECSGKGNLRVYVLNTAKTQAPGKVGTDGKYLYNVTSVEDVQEQSVYFNNTQNWNNVTANLYDNNGALVQSIQMSKVKDGVYACTYTGSKTGLKVVFTNGSGSSVKAEFKDGGYYDTSGYKGQYEGDIIQVQSVTLDQKEINMNTGEKKTVKATVAPENAKYKGLSWSSSNKDVATVEKGIITAEGAGTAVIKAQARNGVEASVKVTVKEVPYDYEKVADGKLAIYFKKPSGWGSSVNCYAYNTTNGTNNKLTGEWPGTAMEKLPNGVYRCVLDEATAKSGKVLFNSNGAQVPASGGFDIKSYALYDQNGYCETIVPSDKKHLSAKLSTSVDSPQKVNTKITLKAAADGGSGVYMYKFSEYDSVGKESILQDYSDKSSYTWVPKNAGKVTLCLEVKDSNGAVEKNVIGYEISKLEQKPLTSTIVASAKSVSVGEKIKLTGGANGGSGKYTYKFTLYTNGKWKDLQSYGASNTYTWTATEAGKYSLYVAVDDSDGNHTNAYVPIEVKNEQLTVSVKAATKSVLSGEKVNLTAIAQGGSGKYSYKFVLYDNGKWKDLRAYGESNTYIWTASKVGKYSLYVAVNDSNGKHTNAYVPIEVKNGQLSASVEASIKSVAIGEKVKLTAKAVGGSGKYSYKFVLYDNGKWEELQVYGDSNTYTWTATKVGKYSLYVAVNDSEGKHTNSYVPIEVKNKELETSLGISVSSVSGSNIIKLKADATGGSGKYQYKFIVCDEKGMWEELRGYGDSNSYIWNAKEGGKYTIYVRVTDSDGGFSSAELPFYVIK